MRIFLAWAKNPVRLPKTESCAEVCRSAWSIEIVPKVENEPTTRVCPRKQHRTLIAIPIL